MMTLVPTLELCDQKFLIAWCSMTAYPITLQLTQRAGNAVQEHVALQYVKCSRMSVLKTAHMHITS
jgi:hypothetical protein